MKSESTAIERGAHSQAPRAYLRLPLQSRRSLGAQYHLLTFRAGADVPALPGQFAMIRSERWGTAPLLARPMSLLTGGSNPSMLIKVVGLGTARMAAAEPGEMFSMLAPLGVAFSPCPEDVEPILVAGGVGVAPLLFFARAFFEQFKRRARVLYGGRSAGDLPLCDELSAIARLDVTTEDGSQGEKGLVTRLLEEVLKQQTSGAKAKIYTCGPNAMMKAVAGLCAEAGVSCEVSLEAPMACGYGVCLGCAVPKASGGFLYACIEGPCVDAAQLGWGTPA